MKIQELRIGNWINLHNNSSFESYQIDSGYDLIDDNCDNISPIILTEKWLLLFGFKRFCKDFSKNGVIIHTRKRGYVLRKSVPDIKYVHTLQNLYFALTNTELSVSKI